MQHLTHLTDMIISISALIGFVAYSSIEHLIKGAVKLALYIIHNK